MRLKKAAVIVSSLLLMLILLTPVFAFSYETSYTIDVPYDFPVRPGDPEWFDFDNNDDMVAACQIPEEVLYDMTTEALLLTLLDYPLGSDIFMHYSLREGIFEVSKYFNGLQELLSREDLPDAIEKVLVSVEETPSTIDACSDEYFETLQDIQIMQALNIYSTDADMVSPMYITDTVDTPNGSKVEVALNLTWEDVGAASPSYREWYINDQESKYPKARYLASNPASPAYNCHSYAWYSTSSSNNANMGNPSLYITDGSYVRDTTAHIGDRVIYGSTDAPRHSAIVVSTDILVRSKWGWMGVYEHAPNYCPWKYSTSFWKLA